MIHRKLLTRQLVVLPVIAVFLLVLGASSALALDASNGSRTLDDRDNIVDFVSSHPRDCWSFFDTIYYAGDVWEAFTKKDDTHNLGDEIAVWVSHAPADGEMPSKPTHYRVVEDGQSWAWSNGNDRRRPNAARFAVFKDKLFLYVAKTYDYDTGCMLWQKQIDPIAAEYVEDTRWNPPGVLVLEHRPHDSDHPQVIRGLVVKVINDTLHILFQYSNTKDLYLITSTDGETFTGGTTPIHTFTGKDCLLNGDVVSRDADGKPLLAFVTKDDVYGGDDSTGTCKIWTLDPETKAVAEVATLPSKYKELTIASGNVYGCTQDAPDPSAPDYTTTALQLWGMGWSTDTVYHMQFVFNATGTGGTFNPGGRVSTASSSGHIENDSRGRLASCIAPEKVEDTLADGTAVTSLQQYARVWWWGSTDDSGDNAHGRSMKYRMEYLKNLGTTDTNTGGKSTVQDPWVLLGVVNGLPPFYANDTDLGHLADNYMVTWGTSQTIKLTSTVESEKTLSISYKKDEIFGIPTVSSGFSYSNAVQQKAERTKESTTTQNVFFSPAYGSDSLAWGVYMAPTISNEHYQLLGPDKTTDLDVDLYYTYIGSISSLIALQYDNTAPAAAATYWAGVKTYPESTEYWHPRWTGDYTNIPLKTSAYQGIENDFLTQGSGSDYTLSNSDTQLKANSAKNKIGVSAGGFGFEAGCEGSTTIASSTETTIGTNLYVKYAVPAFEPPLREKDKPADYGKYLYWMNMRMYFLEPLSKDAFWIPAGVKTQYTQSLPWCLTWHVNDYESVETAATAIKQAKLPRLCAGAGEAELAPGLRTALAAKLKALKAAYERGDVKATLNVLQAVINQVEAQSGKGIPAATAERWVYILERTRPLLME